MAVGLTYAYDSANIRNSYFSYGEVSSCSCLLVDKCLQVVIRGLTVPVTVTQANI